MRNKLYLSRFGNQNSSQRQLLLQSLSTKPGNSFQCIQNRKTTVPLYWRNGANGFSKHPAIAASCSSNTLPHNEYISDQFEWWRSQVIIEQEPDTMTKWPTSARNGCGCRAEEGRISPSRIESRSTSSDGWLNTISVICPSNFTELSDLWDIPHIHGMQMITVPCWTQASILLWWQRHIPQKFQLGVTTRRISPAIAHMRSQLLFKWFSFDSKEAEKTRKCPKMWHRVAKFSENTNHRQVCHIFVQGWSWGQTWHHSYPTTPHLPLPS